MRHFSYKLASMTACSTDAIRSFDGVEVAVDRMSVPYLSGASRLTFAGTIERQGFTIDSGQQNTCACGESFH